MTERLSPYRFSDNVGADTTETYTRRIESDATIEHVMIRIYSGAELDLQIKPFVLKGRDRQPLINYEGKDYVDGDDDVWPFTMSEPIEEGEEIGVEVTNKDASNAYDFAAHIHVDYAGGVRRALSSIVRGGNKGWL